AIDDGKKVADPLSQQWPVQVKGQERLLVLDPEHRWLSGWSEPRCCFPIPSEIDCEDSFLAGLHELIDRSTGTSDRDLALIVNVDNQQRFLLLRQHLGEDSR